MSRFRCTSLLFFCAALAACASDEPAASDGPVYQARDSAGVQIVQVSQDVWGEGDGWRVGAEPELVIGSGTDPDDELYQVRGAARLSDGSIAVANLGTAEIRLYGPDGTFVRAMGGEGEGPGEFTTLFGLGRRGDTLVAHDFRALRLTSYLADGTLVETTTSPREGSLANRLFPTSFGAVGVHLEARNELPEEYTYVRREARFVRYGRDGALLGEMDRLPGAEMLYRGSTEGNAVFIMSTTPLVAHQQREAVVGDRLVAGITDRFELRIYAPDGRLERLVRAPSRERGVTAEEWGRVVDEELQDAETPEQRRAVTELAELAPAPEARPAFGRFVADREGYVWLEPYRPDPGPTVPWLVVDIEGPILGTVELPAGFSPTEIGADYVLGTVRDEMEVETVRLYALTR